MRPIQYNLNLLQRFNALHLGEIIEDNLPQ